jgi:hypothetical protein
MVYIHLISGITNVLPLYYAASLKLVIRPSTSGVFRKARLLDGRLRQRAADLLVIAGQ